MYPGNTPVPVMNRRHRRWRLTLLDVVYGVAMAAQASLVFLFPDGNRTWLVLAGWGLFAVSAVLGWLPIFVFRRRGRVAKGKSYVHTTTLVTTGIYAVVRHPQFLAGDFLAVAVMCITQRWPAYVVGAVAVAANRWTMVKADRRLVAKFGEPYQEYSRRVPRTNLLLGTVRWLHRRRGSNREAKP